MIRIVPDHTLDAVRLIEAAQLAGVELEHETTLAAELCASFLRVRGIACRVEAPLTAEQEADLLRVAAAPAEAALYHWLLDDSGWNLGRRGLVERRGLRLYLTLDGCDAVDEIRRRGRAA